MSNNVTEELAKTSYDDGRSSEDTTITQISATYGLLDLTLTVTDAAAS